MSWIGKEGKDMFHLQSDAHDIAAGLCSDLDQDMKKIGISITDFKIESFSYPEQIAKMQEKVAAQSMVGDMGKYQQMAVAGGMENGGNGSSVASDMVQMQMGMMMGQQMMKQMNTPVPQNTLSDGPEVQPGSSPKFCPNCGTPSNGAKFCSNCGNKLS
jgi:membrane protease subunit (stomatin/prohibitin family)